MLAVLAILLAVGCTVLVNTLVERRDGVSDVGADGGPVGVGEPAVSGGFEFTVTQVQDDVESFGDAPFTSEPSGRYLVVSVQARNVGEEPEYFASTDARVIGVDGKEYSADESASVLAEEGGTLFEEVNPGSVAEGRIPFDLPRSADPERIELSGWTSYDDPAVILLSD
ncbi:DUF4352 domain-containing protein [Nocardiopsis halophila]|uniref:DUF4352 domain-containing protein n=1 Tax=Nocardiopsis halophila TaxID=141692 RepID=UPI000345833A|nr:DUF4352 domain-containing protein [Nocardiopsis halophila]